MVRGEKKRKERGKKEKEKGKGEEGRERREEGERNRLGVTEGRGLEIER